MESFTSNCWIKSIKKLFAQVNIYFILMDILFVLVNANKNPIKYLLLMKNYDFLTQVLFFLSKVKIFYIDLSS